VAIGEIGFDRQTAEEESAIRAQLKFAKQFDMPVLVHLPHQFKKVGTGTHLASRDSEGMNPERILLDTHGRNDAVIRPAPKFWAPASAFTRSQS